MKNREDLIRQWRRETVNHALEASDFNQFQDIGWIGENNPSMEGDFDELLEDCIWEHEKMDKKELLKKIKFFWDQRNEDIVRLENEVEAANNRLQNLPEFLEYVKWLEEKLA